MTDYVFNAQNSLEVVDSDALVLQSADTVLVEDGGWVRATGITGNGIVSSASNNSIVINGIVSSSATAAGTAGINLNDGGAITIGETGQVLGYYGIFFSGNSIIRNMGEIHGLGGVKTAILSLDAHANFSLYNSGNIYGNIDLSGRSIIITNNGSIDGDVKFRSSGAIYDGRSGIITGIVRLLESNIAYGGSHDETFNAGRGGDNTIHGGAGNDTIVLSPEGSSVTVDLRINGRQIINNSGNSITLTGIENITVAVGVRVALTGDGAANILRTGSGADSLHGGEGNDTLEGGGGNDTLDGGGGVNTAVFSGHESDYTVTRNGGTVTIQHNNGDDGTDTLTNIRFARFEADNKTVALFNAAPVIDRLTVTSIRENLPANTQIGQLVASDADGDALTFSIVEDPDDAFDIRDGYLVITRSLDYETKTQHSVSVKVKDAWGGESVRDFVITVTDVADTDPGTPTDPGNPGTPGNPNTPVDLVLRGTSKANRLTGQGGNDTIYGGLGKDVLTGGAGKDIFVFDTKPNKKKNLDTITDFNVKDDTIWLDNKIFKVLGKGTVTKPGKLNKKFFKVADKAKDKDDYLIYDKKKGILYYDADGSGGGKQVEIAKMSKNLKLKYNDFFVI